MENKRKITTKDKWEYGDVIALLPVLRVNHCQLLLHMFKNIIYINSTEKSMNQFSIRYMVNPILYVKKSSENKLINS